MYIKNRQVYNLPNLKVVENIRGAKVFHFLKMIRAHEKNTNFTLLCTRVSVEYQDKPIEHIPLSSVDLLIFFQQ